jgi:DNA-binding NarL/FixJ family response regulator
MPRRPVRVLVVADSDVAAARLEAALRGGDRCVLVGAPGALSRLVDEHDPAVVVLAARATRVSAVLGSIADVAPSPPLVLVVDDPRAVWTPAARRAGVRGVLDRGARDEEILAAVAGALAGLVTLDPEVLDGPRPARLGGRGGERALTPREREILEMLAEGLSNRAIGRRLQISPYTVKFHVASILDKLRAASRTEAVTLGVRRGLISL